MKKNYGIPYMGSKRAIIKDLISLFPNAENFYDLFGGGFSVTHAMLDLRLGDYKRFIFNELKSDVVDLINKAIKGEYSYEKFKPRFVSREEFFDKKENCAYTRLLWSFGNDQRTYLFGRTVEGLKKSMHNAVVFNVFDDVAKNIFGIDTFEKNMPIRERRFAYRKIIRGNIKENNGRLENLERIQRLQQLERLERLQQLERLELSARSYEDVIIRKNSVIYCDIPYKDTKDYGVRFDREKFLDWADAQTEPVFISEYEIEDDRFVLVKTIDKKSMFGGQDKTRSSKQEKIYANRAAVKILNRLPNSSGDSK